MKNKKLGLYIHVPFCLSKCAYCDFYSLPSDKRFKEYTAEIIKDIENAGKRHNDRTVDTVFFGGGTPSLLGSENFKLIFNALHSAFDIDENSEISVEVNPATVDMGLALTLAECGVNRVSIGLQSSDENELRILSRAHSYADFLRTHSLVKEYITDNVNVDIMFGIPLQNHGTLAKTLSDVLSLSPSHISAYSLKIEPGTPFYKNRNALSFPDEDAQSDMYLMICERLNDANLFQYEISNFALSDHECRHNLKYWSREEYLGFGPSAHSFIDNTRYSYTRSLEEYISERKLDELRTLSESDIANEKIMLGLRLTKGIVPDNEILKNAKLYINNGFMTFKDGRLSFTPKGFLVSNYILSDLIT